MGVEFVMRRLQQQSQGGVTHPHVHRLNDDNDEEDGSRSNSSKKYDTYLTFVLWALLISLSINLILVLRYYKGADVTQPSTTTSFANQQQRLRQHRQAEAATSALVFRLQERRTNNQNYNEEDQQQRHLFNSTATQQGVQQQQRDHHDEFQRSKNNKNNRATKLLLLQRAKQHQKERQRKYQEQNKKKLPHNHQRQRQRQGPQQSKRHQHAILIPYRDREYHLQNLTQHLNRYFQRHFNSSKDEFSLWIIEQANDDVFNKGWLGNVGLKEIMKAQPDTNCIIWHDVDLIPDDEEGIVPYNYCDSPIQLGSELEHFDWFVPSVHLNAGGVISMHLADWKQINGLSNSYVGWGGEDDDLFYRLQANNLLKGYQQWGPYEIVDTLVRPTLGRGKYYVIHNKEDDASTNQDSKYHHSTKVEGNVTLMKQLLDEMGKGSDRWKYDGISNVQYRLLLPEEEEVSRQQMQIIDLMVDTHDGFSSFHHLFALPSPSYTTISNSTSNR